MSKNVLHTPRNIVAVDNYLGKVGFDETIDASYMILNEGLSNEQFIEIHRRLMYMYDRMEQCTGKHLLDSSKLNIISSVAQEWACGIVLPELIKASPNKKLTLAIVLNEDIYQDYILDGITKRLGSQTIVRFFKDAFEARQWLSHQ